jgi:hypothetical protein
VKQKVSENAHRVGGERGELRTTASLQGAQIRQQYFVTEGLLAQVRRMTA